jgi:hypothetical protein
VSYRDDLDAATARIDALELELAARGGADERIEELRRRNRQLEDELGRKQRELDTLAEKIYGPSTAPKLTEMSSLPAHNRRRASRLSGSAVNALCPSCLASGDRVQMVRPVPPMLAETKELTPVLCPMCATFGMLRP